MFEFPSENIGIGGSGKLGSELFFDKTGISDDGKLGIVLIKGCDWNSYVEVVDYCFARFKDSYKLGGASN
jgi:hypothetical protein